MPTFPYIYLSNIQAEEEENNNPEEFQNNKDDKNREPNTC